MLRIKITIYELLGLVKDGKAPKKIKYDSRLYEFNDKKDNYYENETCSINWDYVSLNCLNDTVEILEEPKGIPEKICTNRIINTKDILEFEMIQNKINAEYTYAINWILDYLKSKGE